VGEFLVLWFSRLTLCGADSEARVQQIARREIICDVGTHRKQDEGLAVCHLK
jgi:hypothetical protein